MADVNHDETVAFIPLRSRDGSIKAHAIVDADIADWVNQWRWSLHAVGYAYRALPRENGRQRRWVYLHREIAGCVPGDGIEVGHFNQDKLDYRRSNLRCVPRHGNRQNVPAHRGAYSEYRGVTWDRRKLKWVAQVKALGKHYFLGYFTDELQAAAAAREGRSQLLPYSSN